MAAFLKDIDTNDKWAVFCKASVKMITKNSAIFTAYGELDFTAPKYYAFFSTSFMLL